MLVWPIKHDCSVSTIFLRAFVVLTVLRIGWLNNLAVGMIKERLSESVNLGIRVDGNQIVI